MTDTLVWDEVGARYYETGVSRGIFFPIDDSSGVPWNGLVSVVIDGTGGGIESYFYDGVKYMETILAEDFQASVSSITTPKEFDACEGIVSKGNGMKTYFHRRDKFHMAWRTNIGNDEDANLGYKIHIAYNCLVQPASRSYQTIADTADMGTRTFVITATPACGRDSYFTFDSREGDLSALEERLNVGNLPRCWELQGLAGAPGDGDTDSGCPTFEQNLEAYNPGQVVGVSGSSDPVKFPIYGQVNNGLDVKTLLPVMANLAVNDSGATLVNPDSVDEPLNDDSDTTYIESASGDANWTIQFDPLIGYRVGSKAELHIRMSITGGINPDDPDNLDADAQVFITTDNIGETAVGGFSDGKDEGMGFALSDVDGNPVDYVIPLSMDAWTNSTYDDALEALANGAYLSFVGADNNNPDPDGGSIVVRVYELSVVVINNTDGEKYLRYWPGIGPSVDAYIEQDIYSVYEVGDIEHFSGSYRTSIDFKVFFITPPGGGAAQTYQDILTWDDDTESVGTPGVLRVIKDGVRARCVWYDKDLTVLASFLMDEGTWYSAVAEVSGGSITMHVYARGLATDLLIEDTHSLSGYTAETHVKSTAGVIPGDSVNYEVGIDNAFMVYHCNAIPEWTCFDLSTAVFFSSGEDGKMEGEYVAPVIKSKLVGSGDTRNAQFHFPGFVLDPTKTYEFRAVYADPAYGMGIYQQNPSWESTFWSDNKELASTFTHGTEIHLTVGPGRDQWDAAISAGYQTLIRFDMKTNGDTGAVDGANLVSLCYKEV